MLSVDRSGDWKWYIDGINTNTLANPVGTAIFVGNYLWGNSFSTSFFKGNLTELSIWGTALSSSEVLTIYNNMFGSQTCLTDLTFSSGNLIQNGSFNEIGPQLIDNPTFNAPTSPDLIVNGDFTDTETDVIYNGDFADTSIALGTAGSGWGGISGDVLPEYATVGTDTGVMFTAGGYVRLRAMDSSGVALPFSTGSSYKLTYTVLEATGTAYLSGYSGGSLGQIPSDVSATPHVFYFTTGAATEVFQFGMGSAVGTVTITDVIIEELGQGWTLGTGWSVGDGFANVNNTTSSGIGQAILEAGKWYKVGFEILRVGDGGVRPRMGGLSGTIKNTVGVHSETLLSGGTGFEINTAITTNDVDVTNISVQEVDWNFGGGWSLGSNKALATAAVGGDTLSQTGVFTLDKSYKTTFLSTLDSGNCFAEFGSNGFIGQLPSGTASNLFYYQTNEVGDSARIAFKVQSPMTGSISNVLTYQMDPNGYWNIPTANSTQLVLNPMFTNTGPEEVTNGDFSQTALGTDLVTDGEFPSGTTAWTLRGTSALNVGSATVEGLGSLTSGGANWGVSQVYSGYDPQKSYKITFTAKQLTGTGNFLSGISWTNNFDQAITTDFVTYEYYASPVNAAYVSTVFGGITIGDTFEIKDVSVKEVLQLVTNGDFTEGEERIDDGDFPFPNTAWSLNTGVTVPSAGILDFDGTSGAYASQDILTAGKSYKVTIEVADASLTDTLSVFLGATNNIYGLVVAQDTTLVLYGVAGGSNDLFYVGSWEGTITNVSVEELGADWVELINDPDSVSFGENGLTIVQSSDGGPDNRAYQVNVTEADKSYKVTYTIQDAQYTASNRLEYYNGAGYYAFPEQDEGTHTFYYTREGTNNNWFFNLRTSTTSATDFVTISSISVQELGEGWSVTGATATDTVSFESGGARIISTGPDINLRQTSLEVDKSYKLTCDITETTGSLSLANPTTGSGNVLLVEGGNEVYFTAASAVLIFKRTGGATNVLIDNISVEETGLDWISPDAGVVNTFSATGLTMTSVNGTGDNNRIQQDRRYSR